MTRVKLLASILFLLSVMAIGACTNNMSRSSDPDIRQGRSFNDGDTGGSDSGSGGSDSGGGGGGGA